MKLPAKPRVTKTHGNAGPWTDELVERAVAMWIEGKSASIIAAALRNGLTRAAVIGKIHRAGLPGRAQPSAPAKAPKSRANGSNLRKARVAAPAQPKPALVLTVVGPSPQPIPEGPGLATVISLEAHMCKWPIGDPASEDFTFCGRKQGERAPYCEAHARVAFQPPSPGRPRTGNELMRANRRYAI